MYFSALKPYNCVRIISSRFECINSYNCVKIICIRNSYLQLNCSQIIIKKEYLFAKMTDFMTYVLIGRKTKINSNLWNPSLNCVDIVNYCTYLPPSAQVGCNRRPLLKQSLTVLNSEIPFSYTGCPIKFKGHILPFYISIDEREIVRFISFPKVLVLCEKQTVLSRIWARTTVSVSYDINYERL